VPKVRAGKDAPTGRSGSKSRKTEGEAQIELGRMLVIAVFFPLSLQRYQRPSR
jgi:hypothetical protein